VPTFVGIDLAWAGRNPSGICWLEGSSPDQLRGTRLEAVVRSTQDLAGELSAVEGAVVTAIDAPLLYSPERWVERAIARRFARYKASAHQAHHAVRQGYTAGIDLAVALEQRGFTLDPTPLLHGDRGGRFAVEVYPHTVHIRLFGLAQRLLYKKGRVADRQRGMLEYQGYLRTLIQREAPGVLESDAVSSALSAETAQAARGAALKRLDDTLDGLTCALTAWLIWKQPERWEMIGDLSGYIVAPRATDA